MRGVVLVRVKVTPGARRERVVRADDIYTMSVREPAQGNRANDRVREILAQEYGVAVAQVQLRTGARSPAKRFEVVVSQ